MNRAAIGKMVARMTIWRRTGEGHDEGRENVSNLPTRLGTPALPGSRP
jgi:hypothetical protein